MSQRNSAAAGDKMLLIKGTSGLGNRVECFLTGVLYARLTGRRLIVDWSDRGYSNDKTNTFYRFFECAMCNPADVITPTDSVRPGIWSGHLDETPWQMRNRFGLKDLSDGWRTLSVDLTELDYEEDILVLVSYIEQVDLLRPHFRGRFEEFAPLSTDAILSKLLREDLLLHPSLRERVDQFKRNVSSKTTIGVHVRYTDKRTSLIAVLRRLDFLLRREPGARIFLSTDNVRIRRLFEESYPDVFTTPHWYPSKPGVPIHTYWNHPDPIESGSEALVDLYLLSNCHYLILDTSSSFSYLAALLTDAPKSNMFDVGRRKEPTPSFRTAVHRVMLKTGVFSWGVGLLGHLVRLTRPSSASTSGKRPAASSSLLMIFTGEAERMRGTARQTPPAILCALAEAALKAGPWSVTFQRPDGVNIGSNDYFSEAPYWWPDPRKPDGPYIRKDGERNPNRFSANADDLKTMCDAVLALGAGAYLLDRAECAAHACSILETWFVEPKTRMNPHLEYGQAIRGITSGRGTGIIETIALIYAAQGIALLEASGSMDAALARSVRQWFADYLGWVTTSSKGRDEKKASNNHATWWTAQVAAFAILTGDVASQQMAWDRYRDYLVPKQIRRDGSCPEEEARPISLSYSAMNLDAFATICRLAQVCGVDLWSFKTARGAGVENAFRYLTPYILDPPAWRKHQIEAYCPDTVVFPGLAGLGSRSEELLSVYDRLPRAGSPWVQFIDLVVGNA